MAGVSRHGDGEGRWQVRGGEKVAAGWCPVRVSGMGKRRGSLRRWGSPEVMVMEEGPSGRGELGDTSGSAQAVPHKGEKQRCCFISLLRTSFMPLPAYGTLSPASRVSPKLSGTGRKEAEAAGAEINTVLLSTGQLVRPHQALPGASLPTKPMERCAWPPRARAAEAERGVEAQEVGSRGGEHPCSWEPPGRQVGSSLWFSSSLDTGVGQPALQQAENAGEELGLLNTGSTGEVTGGRPLASAAIDDPPPPFLPLPGYCHASCPRLQPPSLPRERCPLIVEGALWLASPHPNSSWVYLLHEHKLFSRPLCHSASRHSQDVGTEPYFIFYICKSHFIVYLYRAKKYLFIF